LKTQKERDHAESILQANFWARIYNNADLSYDEMMERLLEYAPRLHALSNRKDLVDAFDYGKARIDFVNQSHTSLYWYTFWHDFWTKNFQMYQLQVRCS
jgi:hypothetical protein